VAYRNKWSSPNAPPTIGDLMSGIQWGLLCAIAGAVGGAVLFSMDALQGQRAEQFDTWVYGMVRRSRRPTLFRFILVARWSGAGMLGIAALVLVRLFDLPIPN
jgi:hypothetical protein